MSEEMRIARLVGWKPERMLRCAKCDTCYECDPKKDYSAGVFCPECRKTGAIAVGVCHPEPLPGSEMPDYPTDLNACAEMEKVLTDEQCSLYHDALETAQANDTLERNGETEYPAQDYWFHATAAQRCTAFLAVMEMEKGSSGEGRV